MVLEARWEEDDYTHITTPAELHDALTGDPTGKYILDNDIDMTGVDMSTPSNFSGVFDGNFHIIRNTTGRLFQDSTGIVRNCKIVNTSPLTATPTAFVSMNYGSIYNCAYEGDFDLSGEYIYLRVGAMTSINVGEIINCSFKGNIHAVNTHSGGYPTDAGGICGQNSDYARSNAAVIKYCYSIGNIYAEGNGCSGDAGGITGINYYDYLELSHCYFSGSVEGKMLQDLNNYKAGAGYISGGYFDGVNCYAFNGSTRTVTNGSLKGNEPLMDDYHEMVRLALEDSENYKFSMRDSTGNVVLPFGIAL